MKKATHILLTVGGVLEIVAAVGCIIGAVVCFILASPIFVDFVRDMAMEEGRGATAEEIDRAMKIMQLALVYSGVICAFFGIMSAIGSVVTFKAQKAGTRGLYIATLVFGVLGGTTVASVGAIFGIIQTSREA